jgi:hypothetical protein
MSKKVLFLTCFVLLSFASFAQTTGAPPMVGNDSDVHGCKASAGYQWSVVRNECIKIFESGIRLDPKAAKLDKSLSAFVVFKSETEDGKAELFIPNLKTSIVLTKIGKNKAGTWKNKQYTLKQWKGMYSLESNKQKLLYQGMVH